MYHYMEEERLTADVRSWFAHPVPKPKVERGWAARVLAEQSTGDEDPTAERRCVWVGGTPVVESAGKSRCRVILPTRVEDVDLRMDPERADWLLGLIKAATPERDKRGAGYPALKEVRARYPLGGHRGFDALWRSQPWRHARAAGLLLV